MKQNILLFKTNKPETSLFWGYLGYVIIGTLLLSIPFFRFDNVSFVDNLFTTVSALSTTGLTTVSVVDSYTLWGQILVLLLIQIGGIGYMTFGSFVVLSTSQSFSESRETIHKTAFSLPKEFSITKFIKSVVIYTVIVEVLGAILLFFAFLGDDRVNPFWSAVFHSVSSFCTAGFSLYNNSFEAYADNIYLNTVVSVLSFLGAIGYIVMVDVWLVVKGKKKGITFTSKIILGTTILLVVLGFVLIFLEGVMSSSEGSGDLMHAFFQSMTALTTVGFNTIPIGEMKSFSLFVIFLLMIVGASPSGTGGGIKSTTISSITGIIGSVFSSKKEYIHYRLSQAAEDNGEPKTKETLLSKLGHLFYKRRKTDLQEPNQEAENELSKVLGDIFKIKLQGRTIPFDRIIHAMATFAFYIFVLFAGVLLLLVSESFSLEQILFEAASALGTVGLSTGITGSLTLMGKIVTICLMFIGRLGPITFGVFLFSRKAKKTPEARYEDIVI